MRVRTAAPSAEAAGATATWARRVAVVLAALVVALLAGASPASAHPLGNFSVNTYSAVVVEPSAVRVDVVVDRAEIPTQQVFPELDQRTGELADAEQRASQECDALAAGAALRTDRGPLALRVRDSALSFPAGAAGLRTARLTCALRSPVTDERLVGNRLTYSFAPPAGGVGWHETTAIGDGVRLVDSTVPEDSVSDALREYPEDLLSSPLDVRGASFEVAAGSGFATGIGSLLDGGPASALPRGADRFTSAFTDLVARDELTVPFVLGGLVLAMLLGGLHAFAPGHGKTVMAAVLVGQRSALRDAVLLGTAVTVTHTLGVLLLGVVLTAVGLAAPERLYPLLGLASGLLLVGIGIALLRAARRRRPVVRRAPAGVPALVLAGDAGTVAPPHEHEHESGHVHGRGPHGDDIHDHGAHGHAPHGGAHDHAPHDHAPHGHEHAPHDTHDHDHDHPHGHDQDHPHDHDHPHDDGSDPFQPHSHGLFTHTHALPERGSGARGLLAVGFAGGLVPSPSALVVLLGGIALGRAWFGLLLVIAYGVGMAVVLALVGLLLVRARDRIDALLRRSSRSGRVRVATGLARRLPAATASLVIAVGVVLSLRAAAQI